MPVVRVHKNKDFTVMSNYHFREKNMSLKAKGLLSLMLSLPENWDYSIAGLVTLSKDGKDSVMNTLNEIEKFGYLKRTKVIAKNGQFAGYDYDISEKPISIEPNTDKPNEEKPDTDKPYAEKPNTDKPTQYNTKELNINESNINELNTKDKKKESKSKSFDKIIEAYTSDEKVIDLLKEWLKVRKAKRAAMTDRSIQMNIDKLDKLAAESNLTIVDYLTEVICRGWAAFYPIKQWDKKAGKTYGATGVEINPAKEDKELNNIFK